MIHISELNQNKSNFVEHKHGCIFTKKSTNIKGNILLIFQFFKCNNQLLHLFTVKEFFAQKIMKRI